MDPLALRSAAEGLYASGGCHCSEAVLHAFNDTLGRPLSPVAMRLASGFPVGMGALADGRGCTCGALAGGVLVLGLVYGREEPGAQAPEVLGKAKELHDWFVAEHGATCCRVLTRGAPWGTPGRLEHCVRFTGDVAEQVARILGADGIAALPR